MQLEHYMCMQLCTVSQECWNDDMIGPLSLTCDLDDMIGPLSLNM